MQPVSDDNVQKSFLEKPLFELAVKGVFRLGCSVLGLWVNNRESMVRCEILKIKLPNHTNSKNLH